MYVVAAVDGSDGGTEVEVLESCGTGPAAEYMDSIFVEGGGLGYSLAKYQPSCSYILQPPRR